MTRGTSDTGGRRTGEDGEGVGTSKLDEATPTTRSTAGSDHTCDAINDDTGAAAEAPTSLPAGQQQPGQQRRSGAAPSPPSSDVPPQRQRNQDSGESGEAAALGYEQAFFMRMLASMDHHMQQLRETQQGLVATVELACRQALGPRFYRLVLVGSAALRVETPGSDVDVVCFTQRGGNATASLPVDTLRLIHWALALLVDQYPESRPHFRMELIDVARVPILRVLWGLPGYSVAVDVSVDQQRPVEHVRWFQRVGAAPRPTAPLPDVAPLVTLTLRCVKWWLRQRQIPRTREGGLPTLAWLLMAVHVCSLSETNDQSVAISQHPMASLLGSLVAFFRCYAAPGGLDGSLIFAADGSSSEFRRSTETRHGTWGELVVLDPTREGPESLNLVPRLPSAAQLLLTYELRRAEQRLLCVPRGRDPRSGGDAREGRRNLESVFETLPEGVNLLPSYVAESIGVLLLVGEGIGSVEVGVIDKVVPCPGWTAPFLHRADDRSELHLKFYDADERTGRCQPRKRMHTLILCPCHFICRVQFERDGHGGRCTRVLSVESAERLKFMRRYLREASAIGEKPQPAPVAAEKEEARAPAPPAQADKAADAKRLEQKLAGPESATKAPVVATGLPPNFALLPSPSRARGTETVRM